MTDREMSEEATVVFDRMVKESVTGQDVVRGGMGRPSKFTESTRNKIIGALRAGNYVTIAIAAAGVARSTYYQWMNAGREAAVKIEEGFEIDAAEQEFLDFFLDIVQAEAEAEVRLVTHWSKAATTDWRAAKDLLARRHSSRWKEVNVTELAGADAILTGSNIDDDGIMALARQLELRALGAGTVDAEIVEDEEGE